MILRGKLMGDCYFVSFFYSLWESTLMGAKTKLGSNSNWLDYHFCISRACIIMPGVDSSMLLGFGDVYDMGIFNFLKVFSLFVGSLQSYILVFMSEYALDTVIDRDNLYKSWSVYIETRE